MSNTATKEAPAATTTAPEAIEASNVQTMAGNGLKAKCFAATAKLREQFPSNAPTEYSEKAQALHKCIQDKDFGCQRDSVRELMEIVTGETIQEFGSDRSRFNFVFHALVVTLEDDGRDNRNAYKEGEAILLTHRDGETTAYLGGSDTDGDSYISSSRLNFDRYRPATDEEITAYFA